MMASMTINKKVNGERICFGWVARVRTTTTPKQVWMGMIWFPRRVCGRWTWVCSNKCGCYMMFLGSWIEYLWINVWINLEEELVLKLTFSEWQRQTFMKMFSMWRFRSSITSSKCSPRLPTANANSSSKINCSNHFGFGILMRQGKTRHPPWNRNPVSLSKRGDSFCVA